MANAVRSPGSTLKPFIYGLAFEAGLAHPETLIEDRPVRFGTYAPEELRRGLPRHGDDPRGAGAFAQHPGREGAVDAVGPGKLAGRFRQVGVEPAFPDKTRADARHGARRRRADAARPRDALCGRWRAAAMPCRSSTGAPTLPMPPRHCCTGNRLSASALLSPLAAWYVTDILKDAPPPRQRQGRPLRLQDRHLVRLPRRVGHRLRRQVHGRRVGRPPRRRLDAGPVGPRRRRADPVRCLRAPRRHARAAGRPAVRARCA